MVEVTQADRGVAAEILGMYEGMGHRGRCISGVLDIHPVIDIVAAHRIQSTADLQAKLDMAVKALESPSMELLDACQDAANDYCEIDGDAGAWISSEGVEAILKTALGAIKGAKA